MVVPVSASRRKVRFLLAAASLGLLLAVTYASPAQAHEDCVFEGQDKACNHGTGYPAAHGPLHRWLLADGAAVRSSRAAPWAATDRSARRVRRRSPDSRRDS